LILGDWQPHPLAVHPEGAVIAADWDQGTFAPRKAGVLATVAALGGLEPGVGVAMQYRSGTHHRQLPETADRGQLAAERLIVGYRGLTLPQALPVLV
jgi:deoxyinosine 3'endonuclease (endonuclease V)